ncbi:MAG: MOSC domain-containing protein [Thermoleophilia bacterium]
MRIISVNVGRPRELRRDDVAVLSGIVKEPVEGPVAVGRTNLDGDGQADLSVHGGPDKAVYAYPAEHYPHWRDHLDADEMPWGFFGENLTIEGALETDVWIGDLFRAGSALLEVTQPRIPCHKLALRVGDAAFGAPFLRSGRTGFYLRVREEGTLRAGVPLAREGRGEGALSVVAVGRLFAGAGTPAELERAAAVPALSAAWIDTLRARAASRRRAAAG